MIRLAKPSFDLALNTADPESHRRFWQYEIGLPFEGRLTIGENACQYRYGMNGAVLKVCAYPAVPNNPTGGYRELILAREGTGGVETRQGPDGSNLTLVRPGTFGIERVGLRMAVRDATAHRRFFERVLGFNVTGSGAIEIGDGRILLEEHGDAPNNATLEGPNWRCLTIQVFDLTAVHAQAVANGAREALPPTRFKDIALYSMIRDPDGNWIELSQRASLTGSLG